VALSAAKRGQLVLLIVAVASGGAGYCVGRFQSVNETKKAFMSGDGYADDSMGSSKARDLYGRGDYAAALEEASRVLAANPSDAGAYAVAKLAKSRLAGAAPSTPAPGVPVDSATAFPPRTATSEEEKRIAVKHWNAGIIYFQKGDFGKARDEWLLCKQHNPANADCQTGLARLDSTYGGGS
jgi:tetratricopeptide (TPR) repeat protein